MNAGSVLLHKDFVFHDGETADKYIVVLGSHSGITVVAKTTSKQHYRGITFGCQSKDRFHNFYLPRSHGAFEKCTWICLDEFYELTTNELFQKRISGIIYPYRDLEKDIIKDLQHCALESLDISNHQETIIKNSLL